MARKPEASNILLAKAVQALKKHVVTPYRDFRDGRRAARARPSLAQGLALYKDFWSGPAAIPDKPIFILSAGWRSGSTLVQRCVMSGGEALVWGEPYGPFGLFEALGDPIRRLAAGGRFPAGPFSRRWMISEEWLKQGLAGEPLMKAMSSRSVANLYPDLDDVRAAHRAFIDTLLGAPARRLGIARWGMKEVRMTGDHAVYLKWLFPEARFIFLYRNPYSAYRSYAAVAPAGGWYHRFPDSRIRGAVAFGRYWAERVAAFHEVSGAVGGMLVKYEDFVSDGGLWNRVQDYLELKMDRGTLKLVITARPAKDTGPHRADMLKLRSAVNPLAEQLDYSLSES